MRATVNFEFSSEEIESFASRVIVSALGDVATDPQQMQILFAGLHRGIEMVLSQAAMPPWVRGGGGIPQGSQAQTRPIPQGYGPMPSARPVPGNVYPIQEPVAVDKCFPIEATRNVEAGWGCHSCATFNGSQRTVCRYCGHTRCDAVFTPAPEPSSPPQVPSPEPA